MFLTRLLAKCPLYHLGIFYCKQQKLMRANLSNRGFTGKILRKGGGDGETTELAWVTATAEKTSEDWETSCRPGLVTGRV